MEDTYGGYPCIQQILFEVEIIQNESTQPDASTDGKKEEDVSAKQSEDNMTSKVALERKMTEQPDYDGPEIGAMFPLPPDVKTMKMNYEANKQRLASFQSDKLQVCKSEKCITIPYKEQMAQYI